MTPERLLEFVQENRPEIGALREIGWADDGRRIVISAAKEEPGAPEDVASYQINAVDTRTGAANEVGEGYGTVTAPRGDLVAYYPAGSKDRRMSLAHADGRHICTMLDTDLMPDANGIQAFAATADGRDIVLAIGYGRPLPRRAPPSSRDDGAQVKVFDAGLQRNVDGGVALWIADASCGRPRLVAKVDHYRIGRLAWSHASGSIVALAARLVIGQSFPRSDLLAIEPHSSKGWRVIRGNVGEQARRLSSVSFLQSSPDGRHVAVSYDEDSLPYALRKQLAIVSLKDGNVRAVSADPRQATGWLDSRTLWMTTVAAHSSLASAAILSIDGVERALPDIGGLATPSPDGRRIAWMSTDLYGNSALSIAELNRASGSPVVQAPRIVWRREPPANRLYARGERRILQCDTEDGVRPAAILVLPIGYSKGQRYPLIVDIHGGPQTGLDADDFPYAPAAVLVSGTLEHDMWAAKGYAVLSPDYRASGRYGFDMLSRDGDGYARDYRDILCNVDRVVSDGIADPNRMAVIGHSHGGTEVNWIVTQNHRFKAAISKEGSYNVDAMISWGQSGYANQLFTTLYGTPFDHPERYRRMSVIEAVRNVTTPALFVEHQGGKRPGDLYGWLFAAWQQRGIKTQLRIYDDERHVLQRAADRRDVLEACIDWIDTLVGDPHANYETSVIHGE